MCSLFRPKGEALRLILVTPSLQPSPTSPRINDKILAQSVSFLPPKGILLVEDIDCAFPSREELDEEWRQSPHTPPFSREKSQVTMSGLLNVLDGIGSGNVAACLTSARTI